MVHELYPKIYLSCKIGYAHYKDLYGIFFMLQLFIINFMYYSNKCQSFCTREQSAGGKRGGMVCEWLTCKQRWVRDEIEIYMRIMDRVRALLIRTEGNSKLAQKWISYMMKPL